MHGLILFAHGARDPRWAEPFERTAQRLRGLHRGGPVALAYLEFMAPDLARCGAELAAAGCTEVSVLPVFLGAGGHVRKDLPERVAALRAEHPDVNWRLHTAAGESDTLVEALAQWALASSAGVAEGDAR